MYPQISLSPIHHNMELSLEEKKNLESEAEQVTEELTRSAKFSSSSLLKRAAIYEKLSNYDLAFADIRTVIKQDPSNTEAIEYARRLLQTNFILPSSNNKIDEKNKTRTDAFVTLLKDFLHKVDTADSVAILDLINSDTFPLILDSCTLKSSSEIKSIAMMILSKLLNPSESTYTDAITQRLMAYFTEFLNSKQKVVAVHLLSVIFQTNPTMGPTILNKESIIEEMMDCIEYEPLSYQVAVAQVLSQACADKASRTNVALHCGKWLREIVGKENGVDQSLKAAAAATIAKIAAVGERDETEAISEGTGEAVMKSRKNVKVDERALVNVFSTLIVNDKAEAEAKLNAVEGLAFSTLQPAMKENVINDAELLEKLLFLAQNTRLEDTALLYGLGTIFVNITDYMPKLTAEQEQMRKFQRVATAKSALAQGVSLGDDEVDPRNEDPAVSIRTIKLVKAGIVPALLHLAKSKSENIGALVAKCFHNIITPSENRGAIIQQGGIKALVPLSSKGPAETTAVASQALAKIAIIMDPRIAFASHKPIELVRPFLMLLKDSNQLRQFEALMALTNLASAEEDVRARIYREKGLAMIEDLQLSDNTMLRRAATELLCNMMLYDDVFEEYAVPGARAQNRIKLLLALSDVEDWQTRRAASGALAILSEHPGTCQMIVAEPRGFDVLTELVGEKEVEDVQYRAAEIIRNLVELGGKQIGEKIVELKIHVKLAQLVRNSKNQEIKGTAMKVLKLLVNEGITM